jgi:hypothetical protein
MARFSIDAQGVSRVPRSPRSWQACFSSSESPKVPKSPVYGSCPYLVKWRARTPQRGKWEPLLSGMTRLFLPSFGQEHRPKPPNDLVSPKLYKSLIGFRSLYKMQTKKGPKSCRRREPLKRDIPERSIIFTCHCRQTKLSRRRTSRSL